MHTYIFIYTAHFFFCACNASSSKDWCYVQSLILCVPSKLYENITHDSCMVYTNIIQFHTCCMRIFCISLYRSSFIVLKLYTVYRICIKFFLAVIRISIKFHHITHGVHYLFNTRTTLTNLICGVIWLHRKHTWSSNVNKN